MNDQECADLDVVGISLKLAMASENVASALRSLEMMTKGEVDLDVGLHLVREQCATTCSLLQTVFDLAVDGDRMLEIVRIIREERDL